VILVEQMGSCLPVYLKRVLRAALMKAFALSIMELRIQEKVRRQMCRGKHLDQWLFLFQLNLDQNLLIPP